MNSATVGAGKFSLVHFCLGPEFLFVGERDRKHRSRRLAHDRSPRLERFSEFVPISVGDAASIPLWWEAGRFPYSFPEFTGDCSRTTAGRRRHRPPRRRHKDADVPREAALRLRLGRARYVRGR